MYQQTSKIAYDSVKDKVTKTQNTIYMALRRIGPANNRMLAEATNLPINCVSPRAYELHGKRLVVKTETKIDIVTKRPTIFWDIARND
mgnify:CR=1 FL=1